MWSDTLRLAADFPLFGSGFGTLAEIYPRYQTVYAGMRVVHAHNDWVQLLAEGGLAGTLAVLALIGGYGAAVKRLGRRRDREAVALALGGLAGLVAFLLHSFTEFNAHIPPTHCGSRARRADAQGALDRAAAPAGGEDGSHVEGWRIREHLRVRVRRRARIARGVAAAEVRRQPRGDSAMTELGEVARGMGWLPDWPDIRDYTAEHELIAPLLAGRT